MQNQQYFNIKYDATEVLATRLRTGDIDDMVIGKCVEAVRIARNEDIKFLQEIVDYADQREPQWFEEVNDIAGDNSVTEKTDMFGALTSIFSTIIEFQPDNEIPSLPKRVFRFSPKKLMDDFSLMGFSERAPDIQAVEYRASTGESYTWKDRDFFGEVKPSNKQGPRGEDGSCAPRIVLQTAEYARHYLKCRPLLLFCTGLLIFGTKFCVGIYDRQGIVFSTVHDMFDEMDIFVRVVRSLTHELSIQDLGLDPTVTLLTDAETMALTGESQEVPSAIIPVSHTGLSTIYWCTLGRPLWTSSFLLGRGTTIWTVKQCHRKKSTKECVSKTKGIPVEEWVLSDDVPMVLQSSWRPSLSQRSESQIYQHLQTIFPDFSGLAKFEFGGDVHFPESDIQASMKPITVRNLRNYPNCSDIVSNSEPTLVLHRLVLSTVGDYLWNYDEDIHMLRGFRDAILTHKALTKRGFLHRNISPGSIHILCEKGKDQPNEMVLLSDVECALIDHNVIAGPTSTFDAQEIGEKIVCIESGFPGAPMTGDPQFMAQELLGLHLAGVMVKPEVRHDIASFIWSILYCIMRHIAEQRHKSHRNDIPEEQWDLFFQQYKSAFGQATMDDIEPHRVAQSIPITFFSDSRLKSLVDAYVSRPLRYLIVGDLNSLLWETCSNRESRKLTFLTYASILRPIEQAIHKLETSAD